MLRPKDTVSRERKSFDGLSRFAFDPEGVGRGEQWSRRALTGTCEAAVPAAAHALRRRWHQLHVPS